MWSRQYRVNINISCEGYYNIGVLSWRKLCSKMSNNRTSA
jgi:hypothetical protein